MRSLLFLTLIVCSLGFVVSSSNNSTAAKNKFKAVVMFHGLGDTAYGSINSLIKMIRSELNDSVYVTSIEMGEGARRDFFGSYFNNMNNKIAEICEKLKADERLKDGFSFIGFSQGSQFSRALVQRCDGIKVQNLITLGGQHQGIYGVPRCNTENHFLCRATDRLFNIGFYKPIVQDNFVPAQYWRDAMNYTNYRENSKFLADINNENVVNPTYKERLLKLKKFIMIKFNDDTIVDPIESSWFGFFAQGNTDQIIKLEESRLYKEDRLGLKELDKTNRLVRLSLPGDHLRITKEWFRTQIINQYIKSEIN